MSCTLDPSEMLESEMRDAEAAAEIARQAAADAADVKVDGPAKRVNGSSSFSELRSKLEEVDAVATYIRDQAIETPKTTKTTKTPKNLTVLLQAIANRPQTFYEALFASYKAETLWLLDSIVARYRGGAKPQSRHSRSAQSSSSMHRVRIRNIDDAASPYATEFALRCEAGSVAQLDDYALNVTPIAETVPLPVLTPREIISEFFVSDPYSYIERQIQIADSSESLVAAARRLLEAWRSVVAAKPVRAFSGTFFLSQPSDGTALRPSEDARLRPVMVSALLGHLLSKARRHVSAELHTSGSESGDGEAGKRLVSKILDVCCKLCTGDATTTTRVPIPAKLQHFIDFLVAKDLVGADELERVESLLAAVTSGVEAQADSMAAVLAIKSAGTACDELREAIGTVATIDGDSVVITRPTPDIMSALGVAGAALRKAAAPSDETDQLCKLILHGLVACNVPLPRRAAAFVDNEKRLCRLADPRRPRLEEGVAGGAPPQPMPRSR